MLLDDLVYFVDKHAGAIHKRKARVLLRSANKGIHDLPCNSVRADKHLYRLFPVCLAHKTRYIVDLRDSDSAFCQMRVIGVVVYQLAESEYSLPFYSLCYLVLDKPCGSLDSKAEACVFCYRYLHFFFLSAASISSPIVQILSKAN